MPRATRSGSFLNAGLRKDWKPGMKVVLVISVQLNVHDSGHYRDAWQRAPPRWATLKCPSPKVTHLPRRSISELSSSQLAEQLCLPWFVLTLTIR